MLFSLHTRSIRRHRVLFFTIVAVTLVGVESRRLRLKVAQVAGRQRVLLCYSVTTAFSIKISFFQRLHKSGECGFSTEHTVLPKSTLIRPQGPFQGSLVSGSASLLFVAMSRREDCNSSLSFHQPMGRPLTNHANKMFQRGSRGPRTDWKWHWIPQLTSFSA